MICLLPLISIQMMIGPFQVYFWKLKLFEFWDSYLSRKIPGSSLKINPSWGGVSSNSMSPSVCGGAFITVGADVGFGLKSCHALYLFEWALYDFEISITEIRNSFLNKPWSQMYPFASKQLVDSFFLWIDVREQPLESCGLQWSLHQSRFDRKREKESFS